MSQPPAKSPVILVALAWIVVLLPLSWGLYRSVKNSRPLFSSSAQSAAPVSK